MSKSVVGPLRHSWVEFLPFATWVSDLLGVYCGVFCKFGRMKLVPPWIWMVHVRHKYGVFQQRTASILFHTHVAFSLWKLWKIYTHKKCFVQRKRVDKGITMISCRTRERKRAILMFGVLAVLTYKAPVWAESVEEQKDGEDKLCLNQGSFT